MWEKSTIFLKTKLLLDCHLASCQKKVVRNTWFHVETHGIWMVLGSTPPVPAVLWLDGCDSKHTLILKHHQQRKLLNTLSNVRNKYIWQKPKNIWLHHWNFKLQDVPCAWEKKNKLRLVVLGVQGPFSNLHSRFKQLLHTFSVKQILPRFCSHGGKGFCFVFVFFRIKSWVMKQTCSSLVRLIWNTLGTY